MSRGFVGIWALLFISLPTAADAQERCPVGYEVFASSSGIAKIESEIVAAGGKIGARRSEPGDVSRITAYGPIAWQLDAKFDVAETASRYGGQMMPAEVDASKLGCAKPTITGLIDIVMPLRAYIGISSAAFANKLKEDSQRLRLKYREFQDGLGNYIFEYVSPGILSDYDFQSVAYRVKRRDYGDAIVGSALSLSEQQAQTASVSKAREDMMKSALEKFNKKASPQ